MKKAAILLSFLVSYLSAFCQYPMTSFIGADSTLVISKGALQSRLITQTFTDTTTANQQRIRQYAGALIFASGKMWVRNSTATRWIELAYGPISTTNIYNSDGTLTGDRTLSGNNYELAFTGLSQFDVNAANSLSLGQGSQYLQFQGDTGILAKRVSYNTNLGSTFKRYSLVDKNYVDSVAATAAGTVTSVATNNATGITGGPITTTGTLAIDTNLISTRAWRQKGVDSVSSLPRVTSVGLTMPSAFNVSNSPITSSGNIAVAGAGTAAQYIRGDGTLETFPPISGGGGGGKIYYFNGSVNMGTFGGLTMYELGDTAIYGAAANFTRATTGTIANFITNVGKPGLTSIPAGVWTVDTYLSETGGGSNHAELYAILEIWNGSTLTAISTSPVEQVLNGNFPTLYSFDISVPTTSISVTDRIVIQFYVQNTNGKTVTLYTQDGKIAEVHTTFTTGIGSLNGLTAAAQYFATGTSGTDFNISSVTATHTFNLPTASATNRGALSTTDWSTFNSKIGPSDTATMLSNYVTNAGYGLLKTTKTLSVDTTLISTRAWRQKGIDSVASLANSKVSGSGTTNYLPKWTGSTALGNSQIFDNGTSVGIGTATPSSKLHVEGGTLTVIGSGTSVNEFRANGIIAIDLTPNLSDDYKFRTLVAVSGDVTQTAVNNFSLNSGGYLGLGGGGSEKMRITSAGRVLIGTTTESTYELDVVGDIRSTLDANINGLTVGRGGGNLDGNTVVGSGALTATNTGGGNTVYGYQAFQAGTSAGSNTAIGVHALQNLTTTSNNTAVGRAALRNALTANDCVAVGHSAGINLTSGASNTFVGAGTGGGITTGQFNTIIGAYVTGLSSSLSNTIILADGQGNQRLYIDNLGEVGIGTTNPTALLDVSGTSTGTIQVKVKNASNGSAADTRLVVINDANNEGGFFLGSSTRTLDANGVLVYANKQLKFMTNNTVSSGGTDPIIFQAGGSAASQEAMRITGNKRVLIGTTTESTYLLDVNGTARVSASTTPLLVNISSNFTYNTSARFSAGSLGAGNNTNISVGRDNNSYNESYMSFYYAGNGSTSNRLGFGFNGTSDFLTIVGTGSVGIGTTTPHASALLDLTSTTRGLLLSRMTGAQAEAIATPADGLIVYINNGNGTTITSTGFWGRDAGNWVKLN